MIELQVSFNDCLVHANLAIRQSRDEVHTVEPACEIHENVVCYQYINVCPSVCLSVTEMGVVILLKQKACHCDRLSWH